MESPNAPAHDFAPAWLKLPAPAVCKKSSSTSSSVSELSQPLVDNQQHRRYSNSYNSPNRKEFNNSTNNSPNSDSQQRFNCNIHDSSHYLSSRHNSFGDEEQYKKSNGHVIGNNVNGGRFPKKYIDSTQRSSYRSYYREKSLNHSKPNRNTDSSKPLFNPLTKKPFVKSSDLTIDNEFGEKSSANEENCNVFNQEFPSLVVGSDETNAKNGVLNDNSPFHSAWSNNATKSKVLSTSKHKVQLIQRSVANFDHIESGPKTDTNSIVNSKTVITSPVYRNMSLIGKAKGGIIRDSANYSKILPVLTKSSTQTTTPAMEILVKNPKMRANKSDFLKSIRNNDFKDKELSYDINQFDDKLKKINIVSENNYERNRNIFDDSVTEAKCLENNSFDNENRTTINSLMCEHNDDDEEEIGVLSSSLEAEHRFLMELGWKQEQDDDPSYAPLTEDEVKEFKDLINARNSFKRNATATMLSNQTIHLNLSPKKMPTVDAFTHGNYSDDESSSSSDDD